MASCGDSAFFDVVEESKSTEIKTLTYYTVEGVGTFTGTYTTTMLGSEGDFKLEYSYTRIATLEDLNASGVTIEGNIATVSGTVNYKAGKYSTDGLTWFEQAPAVTENQPKLNLDSKKLGDYVINEDKTSITATLTAAEAAEVLGVAIDASSDVVITVSTNGTSLNRLTVTYTNGTTKVRIDTSYS